MRYLIAAICTALPVWGTGGVLLVGGLTGEDASSAAVREQMQSAGVAGIAVANPYKSILVFPPTGVAYRDNGQSHRIWRQIALLAPDLVLVVGDDPAGLAKALSENDVGGVGQIPAAAFAGEIPAMPEPSKARTEMQLRLDRSPRDLANHLSQYYGHDFNQLTYLPGMALIAQMRLGNIAEVQQLAAPYLGRNTLERASSLTLAGHLVFAELARRTGDERYAALVKKAGDLGFNAAGEMELSMPYHGEMSDSYFMAGPITAMAGTLTGQAKYFDMVARHFRYMDTLVLREDGLYRHSPLTDAAWGRGNAFPVLGLALALSEMPPNHPDYHYVRDSYRRLMITLAKFQDDNGVNDGMWHEIVDASDSYAETSATAMIGFAMMRGIRRGWIEAREYQPRVERAFRAVNMRVGKQGSIMDVCESTNKQPAYLDYLNRAASLGRDERGGGMILLFAAELAGLE